MLTPRLWQESLLRRPTAKKGQLGFEEFVLFCNDTRASAKYRSLLRRVFDAVDIEGNGRIGTIDLVEGLGQNEVQQIVQAELERELKDIRDRQKREAEAKLGQKKKQAQKRKAARMMMMAASASAEAAEGKTAGGGAALPSAVTKLNERQQERGGRGPGGGKEEEKNASDEEEEGEALRIPAHHPLQALLKREFYHTPLLKALSHAASKKGNAATANEKIATAGLDFEDFVCAVIPLFGSVKERLAVMRVFAKLNIVTAVEGERVEGKDGSEFIAYDDSHSVSVKDPRLLPELQKELLALDRDVIGKTLPPLPGSGSQQSTTPHETTTKVLAERQSFEPRPLLHKDLCNIVLLNLRVKHVNSRKRQRYATLQELVGFLLRMREEHRGRDAARDIYEAMRFAKGMPHENLAAPTPSSSVMEALLDDAGREYITDEVQRRPHRRPSRPVDALMVLMNKTREALVVPTAERQWSIAAAADNNRGSQEIENKDATGPERERLDLASLASNYHIRDTVEIDESSREFFEQRRFATTEVVGRMDKLVVLQRPKLFLEFLTKSHPSNYEEFYQFVTAAQKTMKTRAVLRRIFDLIDTDMSNDLSKQELLFAFTRSREVRLTLHQLEGLKTMQDPHLFEAAFEAIDVDNDGSASYEELVQFALKSGNDGNLVVADNEDENEWEAPDEEEVLKINGETVDDKWDELRRKEGALPDHDPMYRPMNYSNDDDNETTGVIYEELHELYEIFDRMVRRLECGGGVEVGWEGSAYVVVFIVVVVRFVVVLPSFPSKMFALSICPNLIDFFFLFLKRSGMACRETNPKIHTSTSSKSFGVSRRRGVSASALTLRSPT